MIFSFLKRILNFFQDFFTDLFAFFKGNEKFEVSFDFQAKNVGKLKIEATKFYMNANPVNFAFYTG